LTQANQTVGLGIVGAGSISLRGLLPHLTQDDIAGQVRVTAICDPVEGRAAAAAEKFSVPGAYLTLDELLADPAVDAVTIASPIGLHYEQGIAALEAGKHVHFHKTMSVTSAEATDLIELARSLQLRIVASPGEMLKPYNVRVRELIEEGAIGRVCWAACGGAFGRWHDVESVRGGKDVLSNVDPSWYYRKPGGGPLYDMTVYPLHAVTGILGPVQSVVAMSGQRITDREFEGQPVKADADDNTMILLNFGEGLFGFAYGAAAGVLGTFGDFSGRFFGTDGKIEGLTMNGEPFDYPGRELASQHSDGGRNPGQGGTEWLLPHISGVHREIEEQHVYEDVMQLVDWIRDGTPSIVTAEHARHVIEIIEAAYRASETGSSQVLTTTFDRG
jgi:predicted dehydrogenase